MRQLRLAWPLAALVALAIGMDAQEPVPPEVPPGEQTNVNDAGLPVPGRIRVVASRRTAEISALSKDVDHRPYPEPWIPARLGDRLAERDGLRTRAASSAQLSFADGSLLRIGERSLVFLLGTRPGRDGSASKALEIRQGQADVEAPANEDPRPDVEIQLEGATARAHPGGEHPSRARVRLAEDGTAQVMVFSGAGEVEGDGATVAVDAGMGTTVPKGARPRAPERLLQAPRPWRPRADEPLDHANPRMSWDPVPGAASYTLEICRDPGCGQVVARLTGLAEPEGGPDLLPLADLYWRVSAVSASGLDGFASQPRAFSVRSLWRKPHPGKRE